MSSNPAPSETKLYAPPAAFVQGAHVSGMAAYRKLCDEAESDYAGFWARLAREFLSWKQIGRAHV